MQPKSSRPVVDSQNRLIITDTVEKISRLSAKRKPDRKTKISYETIVSESAGKRQLKKLVLDGTWSLTPGHDLKFHVLASRSPLFGKTLIFRGDIERAGGDFLSFRVRDCRSFSGARGSTLQLKGRWRADDFNRITFNVAKSRGRYDRLTFQGAWQVNRYNEIVYRYARTYLRTKKKRAGILTFKGRWELGKDYILYRLDRGRDSFFKVKADLHSRSLFAREGKIKYLVGIKYLRRKVYRKVRESITIRGKWELRKDLKVGFAVTYSGGKRQEMDFLAEKLMAGHGSVAVSLKKKSGEKLGVQVMFIKPFKDDAELFLALSKFSGESRIEGGLRVKF